jgi:hypothetical protein
MNANNATPDEELPEVPADAAAAETATEAHDPEDGATDEVAADASQTGEVAPAPVQTVYVTAPTPPRPRGNRGLGAVLAVLAAVVFAVAYAGVTTLLIMFVHADGVADAIGQFVVGPIFYVPVIVFLVLMVLWALLVNRASWWAWVVGSLVIAAATYFASIGVLMLIAGGFGLTASAAALAFIGFALNPALVAAALLAREAAIWFGGAIAKRGRRVRERNYEAWQAFERDEAQKRAEFADRAAV